MMLIIYNSNIYNVVSSQKTSNYEMYRTAEFGDWYFNYDVYLMYIISKKVVKLSKLISKINKPNTIKILNSIFNIQLLIECKIKFYRLKPVEFKNNLDRLVLHNLYSV